MMLTSFISQLLDIMESEEDYDENFQKPTYDVFMRSLRLVFAAEALRGLNPTEPYQVRVSPDGDGGVRITWDSNGARVLRLCMRREGQDYLYWELGQHHSASFHTSSNKLAKYLTWCAEESNDLPVITP